MTTRHVIRLTVWVVVAVGTPLLAASSGPLPAAIAAAGVAVLILYLWLWLPRTAHGAFEAGNFTRASRRYWLLGVLTWSARRERGAVLSRAGCRVATSQFADAERLAGHLAPAELDTAERAVWLNNRAYAALLSGADAHGALALIDEATGLRPDVPALQHTRGLALLAVGRLDDAIAVLDGMRAGGELSPRLEAARCHELAVAWDRKGHAAYADDYRARARLHSHDRSPVAAMDQMQDDQQDHRSDERDGDRAG